jgi:hypothetical protein
VYLNNNYQVNQLKVDVGDTLAVNDGKILYLGGTDPVMDNQGTVSLNAQNWASTLYANGAVATLSGSGVVDMTGNGSNLSGTGFVNDTGHTIQGRGNINTTMTNRGLIQAKYGDLILNGITVDNSGTLSAGGQLLNIHSTTVNRIGTAQINPDGGTVRLDNARLFNPILGAGTIELRNNNSHLYGTSQLAAGTQINVLDGRILYLTADGGTAPSLTGGAVQLQGVNWGTYIHANGTVATLNTPVDLAGSGNNYLSGTGFINDTGNLIEGRGTINTPMTNRGTIRARDGELKFHGVTVDNSGTLSAGGQLLNIFSTTVNRIGTAQINPDGGTVRLDNAQLFNPILGAGTIELRNNNSHLYGASQLAAGTQINVLDGRTLYLTADGATAPSLTGGQVQIQGHNWGTYLYANGTVATLNTPVDLAGTGNNYLSGSGFINDTGNLIEGRGTINAPMTNRGTIRARDGELKFSGVTVDNSGILSANGQLLNFFSTTVNRVGTGQINPDGGLVRLDAARLYNAILGAGTIEVRSNHSYLFGASQLDADAQINITDSRYLYLQADGGTAPSLTGGKVQLQGSNWSTYLFANGTVATLNTPVDLAGTGNNYLSGTGFINDTGNLIEGRGTINAYMNNKGTIRARDGELKFSSVTVDNRGILSANGQLLNLFSTTVNQIAGGRINPDGGTVRLDAARLYNAILGAGTTEVRSNHSYLFGASQLDAGAQLNVTDGRYLYLQADGLTAPRISGGVVQLQGSNWATYLYPNGTVVTLADGNKVDLAGTGNNYLEGTGFATEAGSSIEGRGHIQAPITNNGTIAAKNGTLHVEQAITGNGKVSVADGATLHLTTYDVHTGDFEMLGSAALTGGSARTFNLTKNFTFTQTDESKWNGGAGFRMQMSGGGGGGGGMGGWQSLEVGGDDMGLVAAGFTSNFHLERLSLAGTNTYSYLLDAYDNGNRGTLGEPEALYVDELVVAANTTLNLNLLHLYTYYGGHIVQVVDHDTRFGPGLIIDEAVIPLPSTLLLLGSGLLGLAGLRRHFKQN